jgi:hypothetical protein
MIMVGRLWSGVIWAVDGHREGVDPTVPLAFWYLSRTPKPPATKVSQSRQTAIEMDKTLATMMKYQSKQPSCHRHLGDFGPKP